MCIMWSSTVWITHEDCGDGGESVGGGGGGGGGGGDSGGV